MEARVTRDACPACGSPRSKNNGHPRHGKQQHQGKACARQCGATAADHRIVAERRPMVAPRRRARLSWRGSCRAVGVHRPWLLPLRVERLAACPEDCQRWLPRRPTAVGRRRLEAAADARWSGVKHKANKPGSWIALDATTRQNLCSTTPSCTMTAPCSRCVCTICYTSATSPNRPRRGRCTKSAMSRYGAGSMRTKPACTAPGRST